MSTQPTQPEALRLANILEQEARLLLKPESAAAAAELRRLHAENEALRTAHVQNPAEIEHVAGDVSKNGAELNMLYAELPDPVWRTLAGVAFSEKQLHAFADATHALRTQQPAPAGFVPVAAFDRLHAQAESLAARLLAAPQQEVQEPYGWLYDWTHSSATGKPDTSYTGFTKDFAHAQKHDNCIAVYTAQQPAPSAQAASSAVLKAIREANMQLVRTGDDAFMLVTLKQATAQAEESVLEDAALLTSEQEYAIRQGHEIAASDGYFDARPQIESKDRRKVFQAGFERGWDAARKQGGSHD